jgi:hypothetical protein
VPSSPHNSVVLETKAHLGPNLGLGSASIFIQTFHPFCDFHPCTYEKIFSTSFLCGIGIFLKYSIHIIKLFQKYPLLLIGSCSRAHFVTLLLLMGHLFFFICLIPNTTSIKSSNVLTIFGTWVLELHYNPFFWLDV